eukprot:514574-Rhodomonas_salina.1
MSLCDPQYCAYTVCCYAIPRTMIVSAAICLRSCYATPGTGGYPTESCYGLHSGTAIAYAATRSVGTETAYVGTTTIAYA